VAAAVLLVNPFATRVTEARLAAVEAELRRVADLRVLMTERPGHATELVTEAGRGGGIDALVVFSGDGGFNEALNGLESDVPIGFLPGGGTSVLPRALGLPPDPVAAARRLADAIAERRTRRVSLGRVNGRRFAFAAGIGIDAEAVRRVNERGRRRDGRRPGDLAFAAAVVRAVVAQRGRLEPALEVEGLGRAASAFVANGAPYTYARRLPLRVAPRAEFERGLDVVALLETRPLSVLPAAFALLRGRVDNSSLRYAHDVERVTVRCDHPLPLQADGEDLGDVEESLFEAERDAVSVLA
jgi:diacylglycerol kinase family enzyme